MMRTRIIPLGYAALAGVLLTLASLACDTAVDSRQVQTLVAGVDATKVIAVVTDAADAAGTASALAAIVRPRGEIIARAQSWVDQHAAYGSFDDNPDNDYHDGYRTDCSGLVSYAWQLHQDGNKLSATTDALSEYAVDIRFGDLLPGDIVNNKRPLEKGHVVIFVTWLDLNQTTFSAYEQNGGYGRAMRTSLTLQAIDGGGWTIKEYDQAAPGPYRAQRLKTMP